MSEIRLQRRGPNRRQVLLATAGLLSVGIIATVASIAVERRHRLARDLVGVWNCEGNSTLRFESNNDLVLRTEQAGYARTKTLRWAIDLWGELVVTYQSVDATTHKSFSASITGQNRQRLTLSGLIWPDLPCHEYERARSSKS